MTILLLLLFATGLAMACLYYLPRTSHAARLVLIGCRAGVIIALVFALVEPVFKFERFATRQSIIPVLVDASASMQLFHPDSSVLPFLRSLALTKKDNTGSAMTIRFFTFGDSLRRAASPDSIRFSDKQSFLPVSFGEKSIETAPLCLIVSDGNFSNASLQRGFFADKTCLYVTLPPASPKPFLAAEILSVNDHAALDSPSVVVLRLHGYAAKDGALQLTCREKAALVARRSITINTGFFSDTASLRLPTSRQGRFLYTVLVESIADSLRRVLYFPQTVVSGRFSARIVTGAPCLDQRFLSLALQNDGQWSVADSAARECDALFFIDYNQSMAGALKTLAKGGIVVFCGETPCGGGGEGKTVVSPATFSLVAYQPYDSLFRQSGAVDLPPPTHVFGCPSPFLVRPRPVLGCLVDVSGRKDTLPFLSIGTFENRRAIVIAGTELWRMDFWPLSVARQSETASFLQYAAAFVKQQIVLNCSRNFFVYPSAQELYENDPIPFSVLLPSDFNDVPLLKGCSVGFTFDSLSRIVFSTGPIPVDFKEPLRGTVVLPPLRAGTYHYRCSIAAQGVKREFDDSLYVDVNREEMSFAGQNTALLDQVGLPLGANTVQSVLDAYAGASVSKQSTVIDTFEIRKSWPLLSLIILLLAIEWVVRRRQELE